MVFKCKYSFDIVSITVVGGGVAFHMTTTIIIIIMLIIASTIINIIIFIIFIIIVISRSSSSSTSSSSSSSSSIIEKIALTLIQVPCFCPRVAQKSPSIPFMAFSHTYTSLYSLLASHLMPGTLVRFLSEPKRLKYTITLCGHGRNMVSGIYTM